MSSRMLHHSVLRSTRRGSSFPALASVGRPSFSLSLSVTSISRPSVQTRLFHQTPSRRLLESTDAVVVAACLGVAGGILVSRIIPRIRITVGRRSFNPPHGHLVTPPDGHLVIPPESWMLTCDQNKRREVVEIIAAGFEMARRTPLPGRDQALREASFQVPHEIATLHPHARQFRLEDLGPTPAWAEVPGYEPPFDITKDARVFLYFPDGAAKATAAFVAINADFVIDNDGFAGMFKTSSQNLDMLKAGMLAYTAHYLDLASKNPDLYSRIQTGQLPVIVNFRDKASGSLYDTGAATFHNPESFLKMAMLREIPHHFPN